ncbi:alpha/beta hydrolase [Enterococcus lemanii]|jgi:phospholipase/carboxylesterase|uniref:Alpha/beta hydrolase n=1 Tax=Enterococcus lemanii TaxID=1159752 RepID=A0ABV9MZX1_9ENTE|nr:dienelactone hydrolase family protein [Enterococcus lemanii]MBM7708236.1 phospholipase/carboxylesterase [Enterococcus lemanii]
MQHIYIPGGNDQVFILLHGTGGNASSLFEIARYLDPAAALLGFQGEVEEAGMARYFARYQDGSFDLRSLASATQDLYDSLQKVRQQYDLTTKKLVLLGYSNGANLGINLLKEFTELPIARAVFLHPSTVRPEIAFKAQTQLKVLLTSGENDPYVTSQQFTNLKQQLEKTPIMTSTFTHAYGHQLIQEELEQVKDFLTR